MAIYELGDKSPSISTSCFVAHEATLIGAVILGDQCSVWPGAVIRADNEPIKLGRKVNVQEGAVLHTDPGFDCEISDGVTIGHQAMLHGCTIGEGTLIGIQAVVLNGAKIGKNCLVAAGALVTEGKEFPDNSLILGSPAKAVKQLSEEAIVAIKNNTEHYASKVKQYKSELNRIG